MKASVVIPVYDKAPYLRECLDSVFAQSFTDYEVIAVDDASTDDSLALLRSIDDPRLRIIALERNVGPGGAAQRGMDASTGEYIIRVDADDIMLPGRFAKQVALMDERPEIGASSGHLQLLSDPTTLHHVELEDADCKARMLFGVPLNQPATIYRRSVLVQHDIRFKDEWPRYGEDWMQHLDLARVTKFHNIDEPLIRYRQGVNNIAHGRDRAADLRFLYAYVFDRSGFKITPEEIELQLMTVRCFASSVVPDTVNAFQRWLARIAEQNRDIGMFDQAALERQIDRIWRDYFYQLPAFGWSAAITHLRRSRSWSWKQLYYLLAYMLKGKDGEQVGAG